MRDKTRTEPEILLTLVLFGAAGYWCLAPERWYPKNADGSVRSYDDLPARYQPNIDRDPPFEGQRPGGKPRLDRREIDDVVAFMKTLTDGYLAENPYRAERRAREAGHSKVGGSGRSRLPAKAAADRSERAGQRNPANGTAR